jgi:integrase
MTGCTFKRKLPSGTISWGYSIDAGTAPDGKRLRLFKSGFDRKSKAADALREKLNEQDRGEIVKPDPQTFAAFTERWFSEFSARTCSLKTAERYRQLAAYALPQLGHVRLQDLSALMIEPVLFRLKDAGGWNRKTKKARALSGKTIHHIAGVLNVVLKKAVKLKLRDGNPMEGVELPPIEPREARALDSEQLRRYIEAARACGLWEVLLFGAATGCRRGEILGLTWPDFDFTRSTVRIARSVEQTAAGLRVKPTKTKSPRVITLPQSIVAVLQFHQERQHENRRLFGSDYRADLDLVFCDAAGDYLKPDSVTAKACLLARKLGLSHVSLHTLRHSHGSQLLSQGVPLPTVSKRLGHANVYTTAMVYAHALPKDDVTAAELWDGSVGRAIEAGETAKIS